MKVAVLVSVASIYFIRLIRFCHNDTIIIIIIIIIKIIVVVIVNNIIIVVKKALLSSCQNPHGRHKNH